MGMILIVLIMGFLLYPSIPGAEKVKPFKKRYYAHRGLHTQDATIPENSMAAFKKAVECGYGIELDVQLSKDGQVVVFHDTELMRMTGVCGKVNEYTSDELNRMFLAETKETIPLFKEVLDVVNGKVPIIVELKRGPQYKTLCEKVATLLNNYNGSVCVESFDPRIVGWFKRNTPNILRGQLAQSYKQYKKDGVGKMGAFLLSRCFGNVIARPQFIAWGKGEKNICIKVMECMGVMKVFWTEQDEKMCKSLEQKYDAIIFEHYNPQTFCGE